MDIVDIKTSHNIVISLTLASLGDRILATLIDYAILSIYSLIVFFFFLDIKEVQALLLIPAWVFYNLMSEIFMHGRTLGKKVMKLRVVSLDGHEIPLSAYFLRWAFRMVDILAGLGCIAIASIYGTDKNQRLGDILAGTTVVRVSTTGMHSLKSLEDLNATERKISYPGVVRYNDEEMKFVKEVLYRSRDYTNQPTREILIKTTKKIKEDLNVTGKVDASKFLQTVLEDYIILTR